LSDEKETSPLELLLENGIELRRRLKKEARSWNKACEGTNIEFMVRKEGWSAR